MKKEINIAIDGPAGAGKSTIAKITAENLKYTYIDTGAMYRAITHKAIKEGVSINDGLKLSDLLKHTEIVLTPVEKKQAVIVDGVEVSDEIRSEDVTKAVSTVAAHIEVRELMVQKQRLLGQKSGVVMDGRDIGTFVLPRAELKIFMTATVEERALRRHNENLKRGIHSSLAQLKGEIIERDRADTERAISPLRKADDAIGVDTTSMSIEEVVEKISQLAIHILTK